MKYNNSYYINKTAIVVGSYTLDQNKCLFLESLQPKLLYDPVEQLERSKRNKEVSAPYIEFANLQPDDPQGLLSYACKHGIPLSPSLIAYASFGPLYALKRADEKDLFEGLLQNLEHNKRADWKDIRLPNFRYSLEDFKEDILFMRICINLKRIALGDRSLELIEWFDERVGAPQGVRTEDRRWTAANLLKSALRLNLAESWSTMDVQKDRNECPILVRSYRYINLRQALYATFIDDIASMERKCADPKCGSFFVVDHASKIYCSHYCGVKVARRKAYWKAKQDHTKGKEAKDGKKRR